MKTLNLIEGKEKEEIYDELLDSGTGEWDEYKEPKSSSEIVVKLNTTSDEYDYFIGQVVGGLQYIYRRKK